MAFFKLFYRAHVDDEPFWDLGLIEKPMGYKIHPNLDLGLRRNVK